MQVVGKSPIRWIARKRPTEGSTPLSTLEIADG
jgi:hypothetical protein